MGSRSDETGWKQNKEARMEKQEWKGLEMEDRNEEVELVRRKGSGSRELGIGSKRKQAMMGSMTEVT